MNNNDLIKKLNQFKNIEPDKDFALGTRRIILATKPGASQKVPIWVWGFSFCLLFLAIITANTLFPTQPELSSLASEIIKEEFAGLDAQLQELEYNQYISTTVASALTEISASHANHMNPTILEMERSLLDNYNGEDEIDDMLQSIIN